MLDSREKKIDVNQEWFAAVWAVPFSVSHVRKAPWGCFSLAADSRAASREERPPRHTAPDAIAALRWRGARLGVDVPRRDGEGLRGVERLHLLQDGHRFWHAEDRQRGREDEDGKPVEKEVRLVVIHE